MSKELLASSETAYELVSEYSRDLQDFIGEMADEASAVESALQTMSNYWSGELYDDFAKNIRKKTTDIRSQLERGEALKKTLDKASVRLQRIVEMLRASSEQ
jgi:hypothetical protein